MSKDRFTFLRIQNLVAAEVTRLIIFGARKSQSLLTSAATILILLAGIGFASAATFTNNARIEIADPTGALSWNTANNALSVSCWFKLAIPTDAALTENMTVLVNRRGGAQSDTHGYLIQFNIFTGNMEFSARGSSGIYTNTLIERPYLDRWYHVAVVREGEVFTGFADGRQVFSSSGTVGNAAISDGVSVAGWGNGKYLLGEVQEVAIYQTAIDRNFINQYMFTDQPTNETNLKGYFKLGFATNATDRLRNFAPAPVSSGTENGTTQGSGQVAFEEAS